MFYKFSKYIIEYSLPLLLLILLITSFFFYKAFLSDDKLVVDFSLEQLFPSSDPERDIYEDFKEVYGREDNTVFLTLTNDSVFSNNNLSILEMINHSIKNIDSIKVSDGSNKNIKPIEFVFSLGSLWDDGEGQIGEDLNETERRQKIISSSLYSDLLSHDYKSTLIVFSFNENIYSHEYRRDILDQIDSIINSFNFNLVYDGTAFLIEDPSLNEFYQSFSNINKNERLFIFSNKNVLSEISVGPYSALESIVSDISNLDQNGVNIYSINDCYNKINKDQDEDSILTQELIDTHCANSGIYISKDLRYTAIKSEFNWLDDKMNYGALSDRINNKIQKNDYVKYSDWKWHEAGIPILRTRYVELVEHERLLFIPIAFLIAALTLIWVFRQLKILFIALISIVTSIIWVSGFMSLTGISINVISYLTFNLLMVIGVSDAIHLLMKYHEEIDSYKHDKKKSLHSVIIKIGSALFLTSFTTAIGFLSLTITNVRILQEFGMIMGIGIGTLFLVTITVMPIMLYYIDPPSKKHIKRLILKKDSSFSFWLSSIVKKYPKYVIGISGITLCFSFYGLTKIDSNVTILGDLNPGNKLYKDINFVENNFGGTLPLEIIVGTNNREFNSITDSNSGFYNKIIKFSNELVKNKHIKSVSGYWDLEGNLNRLSHKYTNKNRNEVRISCGIENIDSGQMDILKEEIKNKYSNLNLKNDIKITGSTLLALKMNKYLVKSLLSSFILAFVIIFISINFLFKSFKLSVVSILPNIIPLLFAGGIMGFIGIELRPATAMTFSIALGIAVDDTIHFLSRFRSEYEKSKSHKKATDFTILTTGRAIISTTFTLGMGFIVLIFSNFKPNFEFGVLASIILVIALISSLVLLPVLINLIRPLEKQV